MNENKLKRANLIYITLLPNITTLIEYDGHRVTTKITSQKLGSALIDVLNNDKTFSIEFKEFLEKHKERLQNEFEKL